MKFTQKLSVQENACPSVGDFLRPLPDKELGLRSARMHNYRNTIFVVVCIILIALLFGG